MKRNTTLFVFGLMLTTFLSCEGFLEIKPDARLTVPSDLDDLQALIGNTSILGSIPNAAAISGEEFYVTDQDLFSLSSEWHRRIYMWEKENLFSNESIDWNVFSQSVYYCNAVLEHLNKFERTASTAARYDNIKGDAKFYRAGALFHASLIWAPAYDEQRAHELMGMPLRRTTDFNVPSVRASLAETYDAIVTDLKESIPLLPEIPLHVVRPSKPAAYALLARVYLYMGDYEEALSYADSCLQLKNMLIDFNELDASNQYPIAEFNEEVIYDYGMASGQIMNLSRGKIHEELINMFDNTDLRKRMLFQSNPDGSYGFRGNYSGWAKLFGGLATDEMYLIRAECNVRQGNIRGALDDLNTLLKTRYEVINGTSLYVEPTTTDADVALRIVLNERRKELIFRGLRWYDVKRLNLEGMEITLTRTVNGKPRVLMPNDQRYALPFPEDIIALSGMPQNPR